MNNDLISKIHNVIGFNSNEHKPLPTQTSKTAQSSLTPDSVSAINEVLSGKAIKISKTVDLDLPEGPYE